MSEPGGASGIRGGGGRRVSLLLAVAGLSYLIDLCSKLAVVAELENRPAVQVIGTWLELRVMRNSGAAFGIGETATIVFTLVAAGVAVAIARLARKLYSVPWAMALGLLLGGALGNLTDRLFRAPGGLEGAVVDFISVRGFSVMNLADWALFCGSVLIVFCTIGGWELDGTKGESGEPRSAGAA
ncbi:signal peptidase II [Streptomyces klenkii]|uniref:signal peptidase II n=1 Tax=Streptomyces klenkii TaxID=1420899 RepID=UPI0033D9C404